eukprot:SAG11_NODE_15280_length_583_cov_0.962810_2_plen_48_part_00
MAGVEPEGRTYYTNQDLQGDPLEFPGSNDNTQMAKKLEQFCKLNGQG